MAKREEGDLTLFVFGALGILLLGFTLGQCTAESTASDYSTYEDDDDSFEFDETIGNPRGG